MKLVTKKFSFELETTEGVTGFNIYYGVSPLTYESAKVTFPVVPDQLIYEVELPTEVPIGEGNYFLGVSTFDEAGNESDIVAIESFFDFTPPMKPKNLKVI
jgi:hypothetical protein